MTNDTFLGDIYDDPNQNEDDPNDGLDDLELSDNDGDDEWEDDDGPTWPRRSSPPSVMRERSHYLKRSTKTSLPLPPPLPKTKTRSASMPVAIDQVYTIKIIDFPWSDHYAKANSTLKATMLKEEDAMSFLDGCKIKIIDPNPSQNQFHQGDRGLTGKWVRGKLQNGPLMYGKVGILESWLIPTPATSNICSCPMTTIQAKGCQCGGI